MAWSRIQLYFRGKSVKFRLLESILSCLLANNDYKLSIKILIFSITFHILTPIRRNIALIWDDDLGTSFNSSGLSVEQMLP